jgi:Acyltransferase family
MAISTVLKTRIFFVDYVRAAIVTLVILQHIAIIYAANYHFYYFEPTRNILALLVLGVFTSFNQAWFMGMFFLISGYFSPSSFDRKGPKQFLKERLIRLGIPFLICVFVLNPLAVCLGYYHLSAAALKGVTLPSTITWQFYLSLAHPGPVWFLAMLLIYDFGYATWRIALKNINAQGAKGYAFPNYRTIATFILLLFAASYLIRIIVPIGQYVLFFPTLSYLPQYISFFLIGVVAARGDWLTKMPSSMAKRVFVVAMIATLTLFLLARHGGGKSWSWIGGGTWESAVYALWDSIFAVGISMFMIAFFRRFFNFSGKLRQYFSQHSYTVYVIHIPIIVTLAAVVLSLLSIGPLLKFALATVIAVPLTWGAAYLVRKIPYANRIL